MKSAADALKRALRRPAGEGLDRVQTIADLYGHLRFTVVPPVLVALALWASAHALLRKRDVGSALGWIGLVWLLPVAGVLLYVLLGINRVQRRAERLRRPQKMRVKSKAADDHDLHDDLEALQRGISRVSRRALETGCRLEIYQDGDEAYPAMLAAVEAARASIGITSFIWRTDDSGMRFIEALAAAKARGVDVRAIIDGIGGNWILSQAYHALHRRGVPVGRFLHSPLPWRMPLVNLRSHKKILVIDGTVAFTGGMNIADENVMRKHPKAPVQDTHFKVEGPVVAQLADAFADDWAFVMKQEIGGAAWFHDLAPTGHAKARVITSGPDQDLEKIEFCIMQAVACARSSLYVMTPYFLPDERLLTALSLAAMRGVAVHVVMPRRSNHRFVDWAARQNIGSLLKDGVNVWLGPPPFRHTKIMVVDGEWALIGSANWDMRSFRLNFELCMEVYDQPIAQRLQHFVTSHRGDPLTNKELKARSLPVRLRDAAVRLAMPYL